MPVLSSELSAAKLAFSSSLSGDAWRPKNGGRAYEWWYFDAMSDDGNEAVVISFLDNSVFSPRYNRKLNLGKEAAFHTAASGSNVSLPHQFPAVFFAFYQKGKPVYRAFNEFSGEDFEADPTKPGCRIGTSFVRFESAPYGSGYSLEVNAPLSRGRCLKARFEWLSIESDFLQDDTETPENTHFWNVPAPRSDVSGRMSIFDKKGASIDVRHFRGTGYHDHEADDRWLADSVCERHRGRAHFADTTAVFHRYCEPEGSEFMKLFVIKEGRLIDREVRYEEQNFVRNKFGIKYPARITLTSEDNIRLRIKPLKVLDSSFYLLRFASEMTLTLRDGKPRKSVGITEMMAPKTLKYRWLDWLADMRIGKNGKGSLI